jgi:hypothetical protein
MPGFDFDITDDGGVRLIMFDADNTKRVVRFRPNDDGSIDIQGSGPNGTSAVGTISPGDGGTPLGE